MNTLQKSVLVAPLNWGLGHASRCIPIIWNLEKCGFTPIIATDGEALELLKLEFPHLKFLKLPGYAIKYPKEGKNFRWKMLLNLPKIVLAIKNENRLVQKWVSDYEICGIISDNRLGVFHRNIPSVYITHQLNVLSGFTTYFSSKIHQLQFQKFTECWVPDRSSPINLSGALGHLSKSNIKIKYIGLLSRFRRLNSPIKFKLAVVLSGPEPQRTLLEEKLRLELEKYTGNVVFVRGIVADKQEISQEGVITFYNYMTSDELEITLNSSKLVLCRSGYSSIMDLCRLQKKAFFIPTPGQYEQEYLAKKLAKEGLVPFSAQNDFTIEKLETVEYYQGLPDFEEELNWHDLFSLFDGKREF